MNRDQVQGKWRQMKGQIQEKWGKLTDDDFDRIEGRREQLIGFIQEQYGKSRNAAEKEVDSYFDRL